MKKEILKKAGILAEQIKAKREELLDVLLETESYETACDEIFRACDCLENIELELEDLASSRVRSVCAFFPLNLPLYSLILFAVIPKFMAQRVFVRQPERIGETLKALYRILEIEKLFPGISIVEISRDLFLEGYASTADVVIFVGRYENALAAIEACPDSLFLYNGAGVNPIVVSRSADLDLAVEKTIHMRVFNSGQDCAGPDAILVDKEISGEFVRRLSIRLKEVKVGSYRDREVRVGKLGDFRQIPLIAKFLDKFHKEVAYGGVIDFKKQIVYPTVVFSPLHKGVGYQEFFAPVFHVLPYQDEADLDRYFDEHYYDHAMYLMLFGSYPHVENMKHSVIFKNMIVNDVERGNFAYGGYGPKASFASYAGKVFPRPLLVSREVSDYLRKTR